MTDIIVDQDRCTRCSICSKVCPFELIDSADENHLPHVRETNAFDCWKCGHCEAFCPTGALKLNVSADEANSGIVGLREISSDQLGIYLKARRSVRRFTSKKVEKEKIEQILDISRYAASIGNLQPVQWLVVHNEKEVQRLAGLAIDWMRYLSESKDNPLSIYTDSLIATWELGVDPICWNAPHLLITQIPENNPTALADAFIALTHFDITAPAFGLGTCWAGFLSQAISSWEPLQKELALPPGKVFAYAMMFGYPRYKTYHIPQRNPAQISWW